MKNIFNFYYIIIKTCFEFVFAINIIEISPNLFLRHDNVNFSYEMRLHNIVPSVYIVMFKIHESFHT